MPATDTDCGECLDDRALTTIAQNAYGIRFLLVRELLTSAPLNMTQEDFTSEAERALALSGVGRGKRPRIAQGLYAVFQLKLSRPGLFNRLIRAHSEEFRQ